MKPFETLYRSLDIERPLDADSPTDRALYVPNLHKSEGLHPVDELKQSILMSDKPGTWLFTGHRGVGKSTELNRLAHELRGEGHLVIVADMNDYLNLGDAITTETLLLTLCAALADGADRFIGGTSLDENLFSRFAKFITSSGIEFKEGTVEAGIAGAKTSFKFSLKTLPSFKSKIVSAMEASLPKLSAEVLAFTNEVARAVKASKGDEVRTILILDSLERLRVTGTNSKILYDAIATTFDSNAEYLKLGSVDVIYGVPPYLPFLVPRIGSYFGVSVCTLPHIKVFQKAAADGALAAAAFTAGIADMLDTVLRRYPNAYAIISKTALEQLAIASSGSVRDFFRLIRSVLAKAQSANAAAPIEAGVYIEQAKADLKREMPLSNADKAWLTKVHANNGTNLETASDLADLARLFDSGVILNYRNGHDWCDVHYLLHDQLGTT